MLRPGLAASIAGGQRTPWSRERRLSGAGPADTAPGGKSILWVLGRAIVPFGGPVRQGLSQAVEAFDPIPSIERSRVRVQMAQLGVHKYEANERKRMEAVLLDVQRVATTAGIQNMARNSIGRWI